jgi:hypothetical protein
LPQKPANAKLWGDESVLNVYWRSFFGRAFQLDRIRSNACADPSSISRVDATSGFDQKD